MVYSIKDIKEKTIPILSKYKIPRAGIFGSYAKGTATESSDIDLLVELNEDFELVKYTHFIEELENELKKNIDVVDYRFIWNVLRDDILNTEVKIL